MRIYTRESLETLRRRIDLIEVLAPHVELKKAGAAYKALCPFHDEKTPSLMIQKGDHHYHCFGCGAHGDAIQFLLTHLKMSFHDAVDFLAQKFGIHMDYVESHEETKGPSRAVIKNALDHANQFFHYLLLHTTEGNEALQYLYDRGLDLDFIRRFSIGLAPKTSNLLRATLNAQGISDEELAAGGLIALREGRGYCDFFQDRITFPIHDASGAVIGFSARKYKEETFGGKYVNTPETPLFKKSRVLFGLNYCRKRIVKDKRAIIVEGQVDALRLIQAGLNLTVAGQGTAFGEGHVKELMALGVQTVYLALDGDQAGREATVKIGDLFQREGIDVQVVPIPDKADPDAILSERGTEGFLSLLEKSTDYLTFAFQFHCRSFDLTSPSGKNELIKLMVQQIRSWNQRLMVHESLRKLAHLAQVPEEMVGVGQDFIPNLHIRKSANIGIQSVDPDLILESDFLRWILLKDESFFLLAIKNIQPEQLNSTVCRKIYSLIIEKAVENHAPDLLTLSIEIEDHDARQLLSEILVKKVDLDKAMEHFCASIKKILDRNWMLQLEGLKLRIQSGQCSSDDALTLAKEYSRLRLSPPEINIS